MAAKKNTKKAEESKPKRQVAMVTLDDGTTMKRTDYIRKLYREGMKPAEIAKKLEIRYQYVWQALRKIRKTEAAKTEDVEQNVAEVPAEDVFEGEEEEEEF